MTFFYFIIYNFIFFPAAFILIHIAVLFNRKLRQGIRGRYQIYSQLKAARNSIAGHPIMVLHCASMGEFEHIKPFILEFKNLKPDLRVIILFFSPSGFQNIKDFPGIDLFIYSPFDWFLPVWRFMKRVKPACWIIAKHDVWPNQVWMAKFLKIPVFLINGSLHQQSSRLLWFTLPFHKAIYHHFTRILTISEPDRNNFLRIAPEDIVSVTGDTKYDQVMFRMKESQSKILIPPEILKDRWTLVAGSTWPEDQRHLVPAIKSLHGRNSNLLTIICPHEPTSQHLRELQQALQPLEYVLLSDIKDFSDQEVILVDRIGVLANLYGLGKAAYVGGSFHQNVHNVLEPAVYKIPVLFGPVNQNSYEAQLLKASGGGIQVQNAFELENHLEKFMMNDIYRQEAGRKAFYVVEQNTGTTARTINIITEHLGNPRQT